MKFVIETFTIKEFIEVQEHYDYKFFNSNKLPYGDTSCISVDGKRLTYGNHKFYSGNKQFGSILTFEEWKKSLSKPKENNMKYVVEVNNETEAKAVDKHLGKSDYKFIQTFPWCINSINGYLGEPKWFRKTDSLKSYGPVLSFKDWALMFGVELKPNKALKLTSDYSAEVNYNTKIVQVGCQSIPFSKVQELHELITS